MTTLVVDDQFLMCYVTGCALCTLAQRAHSFIIHGRSVSAARNRREMEWLETVGEVWGGASRLASPVSERRGWSALGTR